MSTIAKLSGIDFDRMVSRGAFVDLEPPKAELIYGELRFMNPAGPVYEGEIEYLIHWSYANTHRQEISIRVQSSINCGDHRPEHDLVWSRRIPSKRIRPTLANRAATGILRPLCPASSHRSLKLESKER